MGRRQLSSAAPEMMHPSSEEPSTAPLYNTAAVVQRTGVPATTVRAWERRYGFPRPFREPGGQRLYSDRDIQVIAWLSDQTAQGVAISRAIAMLQGGHAQPRHRGPAPLTGTAPRSYAVLQAELTRALLAFDLRNAERVLNEAFALFAFEEVCLSVLEPLLVDIGNRWHAGTISIADEHYASAFVRGKLYALLSAYSQTVGDGRLVFTACAPDEWHEVGILLVSLFLARRGVAVRYLGPNLPIDALAMAVTQHHPALVVISAQNRATASRLTRAAQVLHAGPPPYAQFAFGGQAFNVDPDLRARLDGTYVGQNAAAAVDIIEALLARGPLRRSAPRTPKGPPPQSAALPGGV